ncbi:MAG: DUF371 domain-containing protein [Candidatus Bathyarchaeia archaeon]|nr:DUF371 domain-containing protein [Candidatus Bathyarchaeota archaeon]
MKGVEEIIAFGHSLVKSTHKSTFEITKDEHLTERGDCIIAVRANKAARDLNDEFKRVAREPDAEITVIIEVGNEREVIRAFGSPSLTFMHPKDIVVRKSKYVCGRTIAIGADKAASDLSRKLVNRLKNPEEKVKITLIAKI